jgi:hypothetical protein
VYLWGDITTAQPGDGYHGYAVWRNTYRFVYYGNFFIDNDLAWPLGMALYAIFHCSGIFCSRSEPKGSGG